jgi:hypothetical protein
MMTALLSFIKKELEFFNKGSDRKRPRTLYLQCDNCIRENKNQWVLLLLCLLIAHDWFDDIFLFFLVIGHTHIDLDQVFQV